MANRNAGGRAGGAPGHGSGHPAHDAGQPYDTGGDGPPIVLSRDPADDVGFGAQARALEDPWRVVRWTPPAGGDADAEALLHLLDGFGIERAVLAGAGAGLAVSVRTGLLAPDRIRALVLIGPVDGVGLPVNLDDRLIELEAPALLVHDAEGPSTSLDRARACCRGLPDCRGLVTVAGAGDRPHVTRPDEVTEALRRFLEGLPA